MIALIVVTIALVLVMFRWLEPARLRARDARKRKQGPLHDSEMPQAAELKRQLSVDALAITDTLPEERYDNIVTMARQLYNTESAAFSVIDHDREWRKARSGNVSEQLPRAGSFCSVAIRGLGALVVGDASLDPRFRETSAVMDDPNIRFYAGMPVMSPDGQMIGALCVYDPEPRAATEVDDSLLRQLARLIEVELRVGSTAAESKARR